LREVNHIWRQMKWKEVYGGIIGNTMIKSLSLSLLLTFSY